MGENETPENEKKDGANPDSQPTGAKDSADKAKRKAESNASSNKPIDLGKVKKAKPTQAPNIAGNKARERKRKEREEAEREEEEFQKEYEKDNPLVKPISQTGKRRPEKKEGPQVDWRFAVFGIIGAMIIGFVVHIFSINGGVVLNDRYKLDFLFNRVIMEEVSRTVFQNMIFHPLKQPWTLSSFIADYGEYKLELMWYHTIEVFWHALNCGLVFAYILTVGIQLQFQKRLKLNPYYLATFSSILFACHPLTSETVSYLSTRSVLLGSNNYLLSLNFFLLGCLIQHKLMRAAFIFASFSTGAMAIWSNPEMVSLPAVATLSLLLMKHPLAKAKQTFAEHPIALAFSSIFAILAPLSGMLGIKPTDAINVYSPMLTSLPYALSQVKSFVCYYLRCLIVPVGLSIDPPLTIAQTFSDPVFIASAVALAGLVLLLSRIKNEPILGLATTLLFSGFLTHAFILQRDVAADWVAYLPLTGAMLFAAYGFTLLLQKSRRNTLFAFTAVALFFACLTFLRNYEWSSDYLLWKSAAEIRPKSGLAHSMLAIQNLNRMQINRAEAEVKLATAHGAGQVMPLLAQGQLALTQNNPEKAMEAFSSALKLAHEQNLPKEIEVQCLLGEARSVIRQKRMNIADGVLRRINDLIPQDPRMLLVIGIAALEDKKYELALNYLQKTLELDPTLTDALEPTIQTAMALRFYDGAYTAATSLNKHFPSAESKMLLARAAMVSKRELEAEEILTQLVKQEAQNARALYLISRLYKRKGNVELWKKYREDALKLDADIANKYELPELDTGDTISIPKQ